MKIKKEFRINLGPKLAALYALLIGYFVVFVIYLLKNSHSCNQKYERR